MARNVCAVVLAAGKSTRMKSAKSKLLFRIKGKPVIKYVADACLKSGIKSVVPVVGFNAQKIKDVLGNKFEYALQREQLGTGHALLEAKRQLLNNYNGDIILLPGDAPFITPAIIRNLIKQHQKKGSDATILTVIFKNPLPYGRIIRNKQGRVTRIIEEKDASPAERLIKEVSTSHYCFKAEKVLPLLSKIRNNNVKKEYYLTDIIELLYKRGGKIDTIPVRDPLVLFGINTRSDLNKARKST
jgi:bifunctional UDP-N-acetylglucosamine pyrophosphorylase/glucosamine-1-phosphate N-acetyltransferase